jgi:hypothetical protein
MESIGRNKNNYNFPQKVLARLDNGDVKFNHQYLLTISHEFDRSGMQYLVPAKDLAMISNFSSSEIQLSIKYHAFYTDHPLKGRRSLKWPFVVVENGLVILNCQ